jgi:hypothetical protein
MAGLPQAEATRLVDAWMGKATYPATVTPVRLRLATTIGTATTTGTEVVNSGGSTYASQDMSTALGTTTNGLLTNTGTVNCTNLPTVSSPGIQAIEVFDSAGTPVRKAFGQLTSPKITNLGDAISFAPGALQFSLA